MHEAKLLSPLYTARTLQIAALMEETVVELMSLQKCALNVYVSMILKQINGLSIRDLVNMFKFKTKIEDLTIKLCSSYRR